MPEKISILKESGETLVSNIVSVFTIPETEKRYIITTENAVDPHGLTVLHVSEIVDGNMQKIATDDEWSSIKTIMRAIISGNVGSYKYLPTMKTLNAVGQYSRDISVSASASKQMIDNYNASDKSVVGAEEPVAPSDAGAQPQINPSSIFPTDASPVSNDDEVVPGIAEFSANQMATSNASQPAVEQTAVENVAAEPVMENTVLPVSPVETPVMDANSVPAPDSNLTATGAVPVGTGSDPAFVTPIDSTVSPAESAPVVEPAPAVVSSTDGQMPIAQPVVPQAVPVEENLNPAPSVPVEVNVGMMDNVQVATPTTVVPDAQIAQGVQNPVLSEGQINFNATPSFDPNATLDEVAVAAQQMFMEGVKNLVLTIQEKVYRDLYAKEAELKNREALIAQREQELGGQVAISNTVMTPPAVSAVPEVVTPVVNNVQPVTPQPGAPQPTVEPVSPVIQPVPTPTVVPTPVVGPTVVQASNDVI